MCSKIYSDEELPLEVTSCIPEIPCKYSYASIHIRRLGMNDGKWVYPPQVEDFRESLDLEIDMTDDLIFRKCIAAQKRAHGKISVGAVVIGKHCVDGSFDQIGDRYFYGSNLHVSDSFGDVHAEQLAVNLALLDRHYPVEIFITSQSIDEDVRMCGSCRHYISEINNECVITIFNPDGTIKSSGALSKVYPYSKDVEAKNKKFKEMCGFKI